MSAVMRQGRDVRGPIVGIQLFAAYAMHPV